jgi:hypothetical protein
VEVARARRHQRSTIVANAMQAIAISSISLPFLASENVRLQDSLNLNHRFNSYTLVGVIIVRSFKTFRFNWWLTVKNIDLCYIVLCGNVVEIK